jgi:hypothetical protein
MFRQPRCTSNFWASCSVSSEKQRGFFLHWYFMRVRSYKTSIHKNSSSLKNLQFYLGIVHIILLAGEDILLWDVAEVAVRKNGTYFPQLCGMYVRVYFVSASSGLVLLIGFSASVMHFRCYHFTNFFRSAGITRTWFFYQRVTLSFANCARRKCISFRIIVGKLICYSVSSHLENTTE